MAMAIDNDGSGPCPIKQIPLEVLTRIANQLCTTDLCSLRLSCRSIEQMLFFNFAKEFFSCKQFMISHFSLQALVDISKSRLGPHLRRLQIGADRLWPPSRDQIEGRAAGRLEQFEIAVAEDRLLWTTGMVQDFLVEAFHNLSNLEEVVLRDNESGKRSRDGTSWRSYGAKTLGERTGLGTAMADDMQSYAAPEFDNDKVLIMKILTNLLTALGKSKAKLGAIELLIRRNNRCSDPQFFMPDYLKPLWIPVLHNLQRFHLSINFQCGSHYARQPQTSDVDMTAFSAKAYNICTMLSHMTNLVDLRINERSRFNHGVISLVRWLAAPEGHLPPGNPAGTFPAPMAFPHLTELSLGRIVLTEALVIDLVKKFTNLRSLEFWNVCLAWIRPAGTPDPGNGKAWKAMLRSLVTVPNLDDLHHIKIGYMMEERVDQVSDPRQFFANSNRFNHRVNFDGNETIASYTGIDWRRFVRDLIPTIHSDYDLAARMRAHAAPLVGVWLPPESEDEDEEEDDEDEDSGDGSESET